MTTETKVRHTPGPWRISGAAEGAGITIEAKRNTLVAFVRDNQHPLTDVAEHEATANAHVIAAAPDMLEALEIALDTIIRFQRKCGYTEGTVALTIEAAIAKAKGGAA